MSKAPQSGTGKQSTLFGFFTKPASTPAATRPAPSKTPVTPSTSSSNNDGGSSRCAKSEQGRAVEAAIIASSRNSSSSSSALKHSIDLSSDGIEEPEDSSSTPAFSNFRKNVLSSVPTPPLTSDNEEGTATGASASEMDLDDLDDDEIEETAFSKSRPSKRQIVLSEGDSDNEDAPRKKAIKPRLLLNGTSKPASNVSVKAKKSTKPESPTLSDEGEAESEDEYGDDGVDWDEAVALSDTEIDARKTKKGAKAKEKERPKASARPTMKKAKSGSTNNFKTDADISREGRQLAYREEGDSAFEFLKPDKMMDAEMHKSDDPDFDPRTLHIPGEIYDGLSPFEKQFWDIKRYNMDTVLFFQKGKFFELYEDDADIGNQVFDLKLTGRVKMRMVGVPEASIDYWTAKFLGQGYKVGRVDQAETALGADMRRKDEKKGKPATKSKGGPSIVHRELKTILTTGTIVDGNLLTDDLSNHCIAIKEYLPDSTSNPRFGVVIADCSTAEFTLSAFEDDACRTRLETTIRQHRPRELICEKGNLSVPTLRLLRACVGPSCSWNNLKAGTEFLSPEEAVEGIESLFSQSIKGKGRREEENEEVGNEMDDNFDKRAAVPEQIRMMYDNMEAMSAMGGMLWYLRGLNLDKDLFTVKNFNIFDPIREGQLLVLDGQTLAHIEVLQNSLGTDEGTLFKLLCRCRTPFGKRLFKIWICQPLREAKAINDRLDAIEDFMDKQDFENTFDRYTRSMPDLERLLSRIHAKNVRVKDFLKVLESFEKMITLFEELAEQATTFKSPAIPSLLRTAPDMRKELVNLRGLFKADDAGELKPVKGKDPEYDAIAKTARQVEDSLEEELNRYKKELRCTEAEFKDIGTKDIFQIQVPVKVKVPKTWTKMSGTKAVNRYWSPQVEKLVRDLKHARERRDQAIKLWHDRVFEEFDKDYHLWLNAVKLTAEIDCLLSLAKASMAIGEPAVRPQILEGSRAYIDFEDLRHPCISSSTSDFIPNDVRLGAGEANMILLTGPNMAGKSTLLRMSCVGLIMAQIGCYVPAKAARISPCDRIVSRMGASDNMLAGQSTFRVEMEDCRKILVESTPKTLVILDELGRGTSTFDGLSIAYAVLHQLAGHLGCIGFFATHFTSLVEDFNSHPEISLKHMKTHVDDATREVAFLYRLTDGSSPKSYGPHVAAMAGVPREIVERAVAISKRFEERTTAYESNKKKDQLLHLDLQADASYLIKIAAQKDVAYNPQLNHIFSIIRKKILAAKSHTDQDKFTILPRSD